MIKGLAFLSIVIFLVACEPVEESSEQKCFWTPPEGFADMTAQEYETWLREEMPSEAMGHSTDCDLTDEQISGLLETLADDQVRQGRWKRHFDLHDRMISIRAEYRAITADGVLDLAETGYVCNALSTWLVELNGYTQFVADYRRDEPELVENTPSLRDLESESIKLLNWLSTVEPSC